MIPIRNLRRAKRVMWSTRATLRQRVLLLKLKIYADKERDLIGERDNFLENTCRFFEEDYETLDRYDEKLEDLRAEIMRYLEKAVALGLEDVDIVALNREEYCFDQQ